MGALVNRNVIQIPDREPPHFVGALDPIRHFGRPSCVNLRPSEPIQFSLHTFGQKMRRDSLAAPADAAIILRRAKFFMVPPAVRTVKTPIANFRAGDE